MQEHIAGPIATDRTRGRVAHTIVWVFFKCLSPTGIEKPISFNPAIFPVYFVYVVPHTTNAKARMRPHNHQDATVSFSRGLL
jgi:hypothetical protein